MATAEQLATEDAGEDGVRRRDFIHTGAVAFAGMGVVAIALPLVNQMNPSADVLALASIEVDLSSIAPGQAIKTSWRKQPIFIRNLTAAEIAEANKVDVASLRDPQTLRATGRCCRRSAWRFWRLFLPVPRFAL
jgi:ubiquinol-cytochrome c reductase iron-sulfur subunit